MSAVENAWRQSRSVASQSVGRPRSIGHWSPRTPRRSIAAWPTANPKGSWPFNPPPQVRLGAPQTERKVAGASPPPLASPTFTECEPQSRTTAAGPDGTRAVRFAFLAVCVLVALLGGFLSVGAGGKHDQPLVRPWYCCSTSSQDDAFSYEQQAPPPIKAARVTAPRDCATSLDTLMRRRHE